MKTPTILICLFCASTAYADPRAEVQHAFEQLLTAGGFHASAQGHVFGPELPVMSGDVEVVFPDRIHVRTDEVEFIALPERAWINVFGLWTPTDRSLLPVTSFDVAAMRRAVASIRDVRIEGTSRVSQCGAHVYRFLANGRLPAADADGELRVWICDDSGRLARIEAMQTGSQQPTSFDFDWSHRIEVRAPRD